MTRTDELLRNFVFGVTVFWLLVSLATAAFAGDFQLSSAVNASFSLTDVTYKQFRCFREGNNPPTCTVQYRLEDAGGDNHNSGTKDVSWEWSDMTAGEKAALLSLVQGKVCAAEGGCQ